MTNTQSLELDELRATVARLQSELEAARAAGLSEAQPRSQTWQPVDLSGNEGSHQLFGTLIMSFDATGRHGPYALCRKVLSEALIEASPRSI